MKLTTTRTEEFTKDTMQGLLQAGAVMDFTMKDGKPTQLMCVRAEGNKALLIHVDCLDKEFAMNERNTNKGGYEKSALRAALNSEILELYPDELREMMQPFDNGDMLRIPTEKEIFGKNECSEDEGEDVQQFECMKDRRNRIAFQGSKAGIWEWYWLQNVVSTASFALCSHDGIALYDSASFAYGVRPLLQIIINH